MLSDAELDKEHIEENGAVQTEEQLVEAGAEGEDDSDSYLSELFRDSINLDCSALKCFKQIEISSSSLFKHPLYFFPELEDPGIFEAFRYEPPPPIENDVGRERYIRICKVLEIVPLRRVLESLENDVLDLRYYGLRAKELRAIFHALEVNTYVNTLLLQDSWIGEESAHLLSNMLVRNDTITNLDLKQCELGPKGAEALNDGLRATVTLKELDLSFNSIGDKGIQKLKVALKTNESIEKINLGHNNLTSAAANTLQQFLIQNEVIKDVNLEWNILSSEDAIKKIGTGLKANTNLASLNLAWNALESIAAAKELGKYIRESTTLEYLDLSNNGFRGLPAMIIKRAIEASLSLKHVKLGNNPLSTEEAAAFGTTLLQSETLETLDLENIYLDRTFRATNNKIKKKGKKIIFAGLLRNYKIKGPNIRSVLIKRCHFLGLKPKKKKAKKDFGQIVLTLPEEPMEKTDFEHFVRKKKKGKMYDIDLLTEMRKFFASGKRKIDTQLLVSEYMKIYPDTALPPSRKKKDKKKKKKRKKKKKPEEELTDTLPVTASTTEDKTDGIETKTSTSNLDKTELPSVSSKSSMKNESSPQTDRSSLLQENQPSVSRSRETSQPNEISVEVTVATEVEQSSQTGISEEKKEVSLTQIDQRKSASNVKSTVKISDQVEVYEMFG